jgi:hypothetical protein
VGGQGVQNEANLERPETLMMRNAKRTQNGVHESQAMSWKPEYCVLQNEPNLAQVICIQGDAAYM